VDITLQMKGVVLIKRKKEKKPVDLAAALEQCRKDVAAMKAKNANCFTAMAGRCGPVVGPIVAKLPDTGCVWVCKCGHSNCMTKIVCSKCHDVPEKVTEVKNEGFSRRCINQESVDKLFEKIVSAVPEQVDKPFSFLPKVHTVMCSTTKIKTVQVNRKGRSALRGEVLFSEPILPLELELIWCDGCVERGRLLGPLSSLSATEKYMERSFPKCISCLAGREETLPVQKETWTRLKRREIGQLTPVTDAEYLNEVPKKVRCENLVSWSGAGLQEELDEPIRDVVVEKKKRQQMRELIQIERAFHAPAKIVGEKYIPPFLRNASLGCPVTGEKRRTDISVLVEEMIEGFVFDPTKKSQYDFQDDEVELVDIRDGKMEEVDPPDWIDYGGEDKMPVYVVSLPDDMYQDIGVEEREIFVYREWGDEVMNVKPTVRMKVINTDIDGSNDHMRPVVKTKKGIG